MKSRIALVILSMLCMLHISGRTEAGFQDFLKDAMQRMTGEQGLSEAEIVSGLKEALRVGTGNAVETVSQTNGYFKNPRIKIPLPEDVQRIEKLLRTAGLGSQVDAFELSMNRAAERAAPEAKSVFRDAIRQMSFPSATRAGFCKVRTTPQPGISRIKPGVACRMYSFRSCTRRCPKSAPPGTTKT